MAASYQDFVSEIMRDVEKQLGDKFEDNVSLGRQSLIKEFLGVLVSCGELTEVNRERIEKNPSLKDYFQQPTDMEIETEDKFSQLCDEGGQEDSDEEDQVFEGRTTFPENQEDVNLFIIRYIEKEWSGVELCPRPGVGWVVLMRGDFYTNHPITLHGSEREGSTESGTVTGIYSDGKEYKISLRGKKFKELDSLLCII